MNAPDSDFVQGKPQALEWGELLLFQVSCEALELPVPAPIVRGLELIDAARAVQDPPAGGLLNLKDSQVKDRVVELSIRRHTGRQSVGGLSMTAVGVDAGIEQFEYEIAAEVRDATLPLLDDLVAELQPRFEAIARPLVDAVQAYGFSLQTTSDEVIEMADDGAAAAWRASKEAFHGLEPIAEFRQTVSNLFDVSPTRREFQQKEASPVDFTVCFAAGKWSTDGGYYVNRELGARIDWFALAKGGLRLNTPTEARQKILARRQQHTV